MSSLLYNTRPATKRKVYFAFHYADVMRVNNVRNAWKIDHPNSQLYRSFYDSSLWESRKLEGDEAVKKLIRNGVGNTSAVCVLIGTETWTRRWVKYEIARSIVDQRGLLAVHINGLKHHRHGNPEPLGYNPLNLLGIYRSPSEQYFLYEQKSVVTNVYLNQREWRWVPYSDYTLPVPLPPYTGIPNIGYVMPLSSGTREYDFCSEVGHRNFGLWVDGAAQAVGR